ncbi:MAG: hypothetical protein IJO29_04745 [Oscillospiraceae bacterium]|nr:hypothetical protein [Oscillospiraceae bacterium]
MSEQTSVKQDFFTYKGFPLVRNKNVIYYGNMSDEYIVMMQIMQQKRVNDINVATKIKIYLMLTDEKLNPIEAIKKTSDKESLYEALDLAYAWLERSGK